jgi:hypothetical protein
MPPGDFVNMPGQSMSLHELFEENAKEVEFFGDMAAGRIDQPGIAS